MWNFVGVFRANLEMAEAPIDDENVWKLLRRFQILVFDFEAAGSDYEYRARERARLALAADQEDRASDLFDLRADLRAAGARLAEAANRTLDGIKDQVGGVRLARTGLLDQAYAELEKHSILHIVGAPGVGKSWVMKHLAQRLQPEGRIVVLSSGRIVPGGWLAMSRAIRPVRRAESRRSSGRRPHADRG